MDFGCLNAIEKVCRESNCSKSTQAFMMSLFRGKSRRLLVLAASSQHISSVNNYLRAFGLRRTWWKPQSSRALLNNLFVRSFTTDTGADLKTDSEFDFQAETAKLLDIVTNSIYTDKEIFLRELISNASDALEKFRHAQLAGDEVVDGSRDLKISIKTDEKANALIIEDSGIGMTKQEMIDNLGTIARSGSRAFVEKEISNETKANIIGQFGVGFYSAFMVGNKLEVYSRSASDTSNSVYCWTSDGTGKFRIEEILPDDERVKDLLGTRIRINLKDTCLEFAKPERIQGIIKKYSNYVPFPITVNDEQANTVSAIWTRSKDDIKDEEYTEFYRFHANAFDEPLYRLHFKTDAPIDMKALIFVPSWHTEKLGMGRMDPGVSLYSRKILIEPNSDKILPQWLRFVKGVVDSEDLPISLSRESMQDSRLLANMNKLLSRRIIKELLTEAKNNPQKFNKFAIEFGNFIKEGICTDYENQNDIAKLLRFNSSAINKEEVTSLDEYISRCSPEQDKIYYLSAPSRELAELSPYYEVFKANNTEVLFLYSTLDDFCVGNLRSYNGREFVAAESGKLDVDLKKDSDEITGQSILSESEVKILCDWMQNILSDHISSVTSTNRLKDSPAIVVDHESAAVRRMMKLLDQGRDEKAVPLPKQRLEVNPKHPIVQSMNSLRKSKPELANVIARQLYDNALIAAGLVDDARDILPRLNRLLEKLLETNSTYAGPLPEVLSTDNTVEDDDQWKTKENKEAVSEEAK